MEPKTRKEHYLAKIAGEDVTIPEPKTRKEYYLKEIAENGGGGALELVTFTGEGDTSSCDKTFSEIDAMAVPIGTINGGLFLLQKKSAPGGYKYVGCALVEVRISDIICARCEVTRDRVTVTMYTLNRD